MIVIICELSFIITNRIDKYEVETIRYMKYTKTYDNFITDIFTKKKKLPIEIFDLSRALVNIISYYFNNILNKGYYIEYFETSFKDKKEYNTITIFVKKPVQELHKIARLYYKEKLNDIMFYLIEDESTITLREFFIEMIAQFDPKCKFDSSFFISLDKVQSVIDEMTIENLDLFIDSKKYNL